MKEKLKLFIVVFMLSACSSKITSLFKVELNEENIERKTINTKSPYNFTVISVDINGKLHDFIFDTGAQISLISRNLANEIQLQDVGEIKVNDSQGVSSKIAYGVIDTFSIANTDFINVGVAIVDKGINNYLACMNVEGIVGMNIMRLCNWKIDYAKNTMEISALDSNFTCEKCLSFPFEIQKGVPSVNWYVNGHLSHFTVDTGKNAKEVGIPNALLKANPVNQIVGFQSFGLHGETISDTTSLFFCRFGDSALIYNEHVAFSQSKNCQTLIGNGFWRTYFSSIAFDFKNRLIYVQESKKPDTEILTYPFSPMLLDSAIAIATVELGINEVEIGDTIAKVNAFKSSETSSCEMLAEIERALHAKEDIHLQVKQNGAIKTLVFPVKTITD
jgi:hypothetical protein